jgi:hypothetical protein
VAALIGISKYKLFDRDMKQIKISAVPAEIYILCIVSDSYPALNFQAQHLLKIQRNETIRPPFVLDVFTLDAMTEMLESPLHLPSYINRRTEYYDQIISPDELAVLSHHLKKNLWMPSGYNLMALEANVSAHLDAAMAVRRDGVPGQRTPDGILRRIEKTALGRILKQIEGSPDPGTIDFGFLALRLSEDAILNISKGIDIIAKRARNDGHTHDFSVELSEAKSGLTVHCNDEPILRSARRLQGNCKLRKYAHQADCWFGLCISSSDNAVRFGLKLDYKWMPDAGLARIARKYSRKRPAGKRTEVARKTKIGRNEPCPCGSGKKYKKCNGG